ncbi:MAG: 4Fe-4S dicluster domain-containing protein [Coleofasciculus sp. C1-SOL-03]|jgi:heterodisulfide reductase subunit C|uniref:4Fe-4S dicluster domain-containing protein n=1 Tax=Coleofasciculus sp. C1-SOL-03 TaxID=3069522 RepID=UPI0032FD1169
MVAKKKCFFGIKTDRQVDGDQISQKVMDKVIAEGGENAAIASCMQCGTCSGGCTNIDRMDISPRKLILLLQRGEWETILKSNTLWLCTSCYTCTSRCPRGVRPADVIETIKALAIREGIQNDSTRFNQIFVELVKKRGIVFEPELMHQYGGIEAMLEQAELGVKLALRGKLSPFPAKVKDPKTFNQALDKASKK